MRDGKWVVWPYLGILAVGLSGCAQSTAKIQSLVGEERHVDIKRLMIVSNLVPVVSEGASSALQLPILETALTTALGKCGIVGEALPQDQLSPTGDGASAIRAFSPDALLVVESRTFEVGIPEGSGVYLATMVHMPTKKLIWRAQIHITAGESREDVLAASIVSRLRDDSILCSS